MWAVANILPTRRRGNPNWGKLVQHAPYVATAFEEQIKKLGLSEQTCEASEKLRHWCERNKDRSYIPEWLLKKWHPFSLQQFGLKLCRRPSQKAQPCTAAAKLCQC